MNIENNLKIFNTLLFTISAILFLASTSSPTWTKFKLYERNSSYAFSLLPDNTNFHEISANIDGRFNLLRLHLRVEYDPKFQHKNLDGYYDFDDDLPLPDRIKREFVEFAKSFYIAFTSLLLASIFVLICIAVEVKKFIEDYRNSAKYYTLSVVHICLSLLASIFGLIAVVILLRMKAYHMNHIYNKDITLKVEKNLSSFAFLLGEGVCILSVLGCVAEMKVWKRNAPSMKQNKNFDNQNFEGDYIPQGNHPI